jgi:chemotaxis protein MotB
MSSHGGESGRWMVSYADFVTLLFVMFVILYSMGQTDLAKYKRLAQSFQAAFSVGGGSTSQVIDPSINEASGSSESAQAAPIVVSGLPRDTSAGAEVAADLSNLLSDSNLASEVSIQSNIEGVLISLSEKLLFVQGAADLQPEAYPVLDTIAVMLSPLENEIKVIGYTDNTPPTDARYADNWILSTARAYNVISYLIQKGISPQRLIAAGRGEYSPIFPNDTPEHKALNSRAEIVVIYPQNVQDVINLDIAAPTPVSP